MALATDLQGLGVPPLQAARTANAGVGPITVTAIGSSFATGYKIGGSQYLINVSAGSGGFLSLPTVGGDTGALIGDDFIIANNSGGGVTLAAGSGISIIGAGGSASTLSLSNQTVYAIYALNSTTWLYK